MSFLLYTKLVLFFSTLELLRGHSISIDAGNFWEEKLWQSSPPYELGVKPVMSLWRDRLLVLAKKAKKEIPHADEHALKSG